MLGWRARRKHPEVPTRVLALQDLAGAEGLRGRVDGLLCVDGLENVAPEDWRNTIRARINFYVDLLVGVANILG